VRYQLPVPSLLGRRRGQGPRLQAPDLGLGLLKPLLGESPPKLLLLHLESQDLDVLAQLLHQLVVLVVSVANDVTHWLLTSWLMAATSSTTASRQVMYANLGLSLVSMSIRPASSRFSWSPTGPFTSRIAYSARLMYAGVFRPSTSGRLSGP